MMGAGIIATLRGYLVQIIGSAVIVGVLVGSCVARDHKLEQRGAQEQAAKTDKVNDNASKLGRSAADSSRDKRVRGERDPSTRND